MSTQRLELRGCPAPVFEHLTRRFDKVAHGVGAVEAGVDCFCNQVVNAVTEFVEEGDDFVVFQKTGFFLRWFGEVAHQCCGGIALVSIGVDEAL